jgi:hypothetical protein
MEVTSKKPDHDRWRERAMTIKVVVKLICVSLALVALALAQSPGGLRARYGATDEKGRYTVRPGVGLAPKYDDAGNPREMVIKLLDDQSAPGSAKPQRRNVMRRQIALEVLDEIVPLGKRGKQTAAFVEEHGCYSLETKEYDNLPTKIANRCEEQGGGTYSVSVVWKRPKS